MSVRNLALALLVSGGCTGDPNTVSQYVETGGDCTLTQGFWKNHEEAWDVTTLTLGNTSYSQTQLLSILRTSVKGNGLVSLAHQLIAAKLNVANGADDSDIADEIAAADALIGTLVVPPIGDGHLSTSSTSSLVGALDGFNNSSGETCAPPPPEPACGDGTVDDGETCDDGNTNNGDGCSSTCQIEVPEPSCGDGTIDTGEDCDDGNTTSGDGCSSTCHTETVDEPCCGDGTVDAGETCDDGNTTNGDGCSSTCQTETVEEPCCGDGTVDAGETCDDGNTTSGDGCSSTCQTEKTPCCGDGVIDTGETCDDGNTSSGDGCSSTCQSEACHTGCVDGLQELAGPRMRTWSPGPTLL